MKANELMLGDWVFHIRNRIVSGFEAGGPVRVLEIYEHGAQTTDGFVRYEDLEPIHLTPEILEKNGWKTTDRYRYNRGNVWFDIINRGAEDFDIEVSAYDGGFAYVATIYNVHELQHALRLFGIKKEVEL